MNERFQDLGLQLLQRRVHADFRRREKRAELAAGLAPPALGSPPGRDRPAGQGQALVGQHQLRIELLVHAETFAARAGPVRAVETEGPRLQFLVADLAARAGVFRAEQPLVPAVAVGRWPLLVEGQDQSAAVPDGQVNRLGQPRPDAFADHDTVHHGLDVMRFLRHQRRRILDVGRLAVDPGPQETGLANRRENLLMLPLAPADHRGQDHDLDPVGQGQQLVDDLLGALLLDRLTAVVARRLA